jgi:hypothetical protein
MMRDATSLSFSQWPDPNAAPPGAGGFGANPYSTFGQQPPPRRSFPWLWILLIVGGGTLLLCLGCGGCIYIGFTSEMARIQDDLKADLAADEAAQEHLGTIENVEFDMMASAEASQGRGQDKQMVFHVRGSKANADVIGSLDSTEGSESIRDCRLVLESGEEVDLSF